MQRLLIWMMIGLVYGAILAVLVHLMGQAGIVVWAIVVAAAQLWMKRQARGY